MYGHIANSHTNVVANYLWYMQPGKFLLLNGKMVESTEPSILADNRSFRYGDGFFETIRWVGDGAFLWEYHAARFFNSLHKMHFAVPAHWDTVFVKEEITRLVKKNKQEAGARVRCTVFRGEGGLYDPTNNHPQILIQSWGLSSKGFLLNTNGLDIQIYREAIKAADAFSAMKSNSALPYVMAAKFAAENKYNDAILLNQWGRVADTTIANIFIIINNIIYTPPLSEGCVNGVMRNFLLKKLPDWGFEVIEKELTEEILANAEEIFLTNAIRGVQWVKNLGSSTYYLAKTQSIAHNLSKNGSI